MTEIVGFVCAMAGDDGNRRLCLRDGGYSECNAGNDASRYHKLLHDHTPILRPSGPHQLDVQSPVGG